ncbi:uncharacterized protein LOC111116715 [Crassostrea virginica]
MDNIWTCSLMVCSLVLCPLLVPVRGHGRLLDPPSRSSLWRFGLSSAVNYNDNQLSCGGFANQHLYHQGKCGVCGDPYQGPRDNEAGGRYAKGIISRRYVEGQLIDIVVEVTALHFGYFEFRICPNNNVSRPATLECLDQNLLVLSSGSTRYTEVTSTGRYVLEAQLPPGLTCSQCVFQWKWHTGNNFGFAPDGHNCRGCGPQEEFYGCADVTIIPRSTPVPDRQTTAQQTPRPVVNTSPTEIVTRPPLTTPAPTQRPGGLPFMPGVTVRTSSTTTTTTTAKPTTTKMVMTSSLRPVSGCRAINLWAGNPILDKWCVTNCAQGNCPASACACS